ASTAAGLAQLHTCGVTVGRTATWDDELGGVRRVLAVLESAMPELRGAADEYLAHVERSAAMVAPDPAGPAHRSFRPAQVLLHAGRIGFIDFDGFCQAEPAIDVGLFRATVRDLSMSVLPATIPLAERLIAVDDLSDHFLDCYSALAPISRERLALWETLDLVTTVLHAWTKVKPARLEWAFDLLRHVAGPPEQLTPSAGPLRGTPPRGTSAQAIDHRP
ncbi:MAG: phosphotransferase, partial [Actinomycetes bacterium]